MVRSLLMDAAGVVFLVPSIGTPPRPREKRMLRNIFLSARPPLLAVMRGGEFAILKIVPSLDSSASRSGLGIRDKEAAERRKNLDQFYQEKACCNIGSFWRLWH